MFIIITIIILCDITRAYTTYDKQVYHMIVILLSV